MKLSHFTGYAMGVWVILFIHHYDPDGVASIESPLMWTIPFAVLGVWVWAAYRGPR